MNCISIGETKKVYMNLDLDNFSIFMGLNNGLNDKKYQELKKKSKIIYTVVGLVSHSLEYKSFLGYVVANNKGEIKLVKEDKLVELLKKYACMNYSLVTNDGHRYFARKNPKVIIKEFSDEQVKELLGYSFEDFVLHSDMNLEQIDFCMSNNDFKLGFRKDFPVEYFGTVVGGIHLIYFNKEGTQIILNTVDRGDKPLNYYHQTCLMIRDVDHKKYHTYIKENPYNSCSSSPLVDARDPNLDPNHTEILFNSTHIYRFLDISEKAKRYSKPVIPYSLGHNMYALHSMLNRTPYQDKKIQKYLENKKDTSWRMSDFMHLYVGYLNMLNYSDDLKKYYSKYLREVPKYLDSYSDKFNIPQKEIEAMKKFVETLV